MPMQRQKYFKCFPSLFWNFYFFRCGNGAPKTIVGLKEIWDAFLALIVFEIINVLNLNRNLTAFEDLMMS